MEPMPVMTLRNYALTDEEANAVRELIGAAIEQVAASATDDELIAALELRDRFRPQDQR